MNKNEIESQLLEAMKRLEVAADRVIKTNGYTREVKKIRLLAEMIKEQIRHENSMSSARAVR